jgi:uncharacterized protein YqeY
MRENIANALKEALKAKDQVALSTMRLIAAALKDRDIAARGNDNPDGISDEEILGMLQTMIKQRSESAKLFRDGDRPELAASEEAEIEIIKGFLPTQLSADEMHQGHRHSDCGNRCWLDQGHGTGDGLFKSALRRSDGFFIGQPGRQSRIDGEIGLAEPAAVCLPGLSRFPGLYHL